MALCKQSDKCSHLNSKFVLNEKYSFLNLQSKKSFRNFRFVRAIMASKSCHNSRQKSLIFSNHLNERVRLNLPKLIISSKIHSQLEEKIDRENNSLH